MTRPQSAREMEAALVALEMVLASDQDEQNVDPHIAAIVYAGRFMSEEATLHFRNR